MKNKNLKIIEKELNFTINTETEQLFDEWEKIFINYNSHTNLMSKNDINLLFEKHVFDSLSVLKWKEFKNISSILDVGTGGGFPSVILAICFKDKKIIANDSRIKKINFIKEIKEKLQLENLEICYSRIEDVEPLNVDLITSRAVGKILDIWELSKKHLNKNGKFLIYKSKTADDEISCFKNKYKNAKFEIIPYDLPLEENYQRNLIIKI